MQSQTEKAGIMLQSSAGAVDAATASPALLEQPHRVGQEPTKVFPSESLVCNYSGVMNSSIESLNT